MAAFLLICGLSPVFYIYVMTQWEKERQRTKKSRMRHATVYLTARPNLTIVPEQRWLGRSDGLRDAGHRTPGGGVVEMDPRGKKEASKRVVA